MIWGHFWWSGLISGYSRSSTGQLPVYFRFVNWTETSSIMTMSWNKPFFLWGSDLLCNLYIQCVYPPYAVHPYAALCFLVPRTKFTATKIFRGCMLSCCYVPLINAPRFFLYDSKWNGVWSTTRLTTVNQTVTGNNRTLLRHLDGAVTELVIIPYLNLSTTRWQTRCDFT